MQKGHCCLSLAEALASLDAGYFRLKTQTGQIWQTNAMILAFRIVRSFSLSDSPPGPPPEGACSFGLYFLGEIAFLDVKSLNLDFIALFNPGKKIIRHHPARMALSCQIILEDRFMID